MQGTEDGRGPLVRVAGLFRYYGSLCALEDFNLELEPGEILGLLGPNGAGKSTMMQILTGNLAPSAGSVEVAGVDLLADPRRAKRQIGYLPESPPVYPDLSVSEFLDFAARINRIPGPERAAARDRAMARCGLSHVARRMIGNLSKGYRQRVGIAQAIIHDPDVVVLDEPTVGLDPIQIREIRSLITELGERHSVILSSHILPEIQAIASRVQIIHQGRSVYEAPMSELSAEVSSNRLLVGLGESVAPSELELEGVDRVEALGGARYRLHHQSGVGIADAVARKAVAEGWRIVEITPEMRSLEQVFMELTAVEAAA